MWETVCETVTMPVGMTSESKRFFRKRRIDAFRAHRTGVFVRPWPVLRLFVAGFHHIGLTRPNPFLKARNVGALERTQGHRDYRDGKRDQQG